MDELSWEKKNEEIIKKLITKIQTLYSTAIKECAKIGMSTPNFNPQKPFDSKNYPASIKKLQKITEKLAADLRLTIEDGINEGWGLSNAKNDSLCNFVCGKVINEVNENIHARYFNNHTDALNAFRLRKESGMNLSSRIWNLSEQFQEQIEMAIDLGLRDGLSAAKMATKLKQCLNDPNRLFRRVRDEHGELRLSKAAKSYHPGRGKYRSSHKNAIRLARTEVTMAYRTADYLRIQDFDFVVGIEIHRSNHVFECSVCEALKGLYPKDFKFVGWHTQCRCYPTTILKTDKELERDMDLMLEGKIPTTESKNLVVSTPKGYKKYLSDNIERIERAEKKGTLPYFIRDNRGYFDRATA
ncbi:MAG: hypothetical protein R3Y50_05985 [Rikenellaceae bacterium]